MDLSNATLGGLRASGHLCFPYESEDERRRTLVAFIREGLARRERCLYIGVPVDQDDVMAALEAAGVRAERAVERGDLVLATQGETYLRTGGFDVDDSLALMEGLVDRALADGYVGLRATGEASAPLPDELWRLVLRYEARLNERLSRRPFVALCRFHAEEIPPERVQDVLRTHPLALVRGEVCPNPFYERPEVVLSGDSRARLEWQLHQLRAYNRARKRLEARSAAASDQGEWSRVRSGRARDRFLSVLTDELAEPLFALKREVHALGETAPPGRFEAAQHHLRRLSAAVEEARDLARVIGREAEPSSKSDETAASDPESDLAETVRQVVESHGDVLASMGLALTVDAPAPVRGAWDRDAVQRLISTFLRGAPSRGPGRPVTIRVRAHDGGGTLTFHEGPDDADHDADRTVDLTSEPRRPRG